jgi:adenylate cyclase
MIQRMDSGEYYLIDMGSRNGSFVNGRRVSTPVGLRDGDRLLLGDAQLSFHNPQQSEPAAALTQTEGLATVSRFTQCLVSVLVVDIRGFTVLSQNIDNAVLCQLTGSWFGEAERIMRDAGSAVQKYIGDAVMAVWMHNAAGNEPREILGILRALSEFAQATSGLGPSFGLERSLRIGAGLNTGIATVGNAGTGRVPDYTAMGECVNVAFRLESATREAQTDVYVGKATVEFLREWPEAMASLKEAGVELKGYAAPVQACPASFSDLKSLLDSMPAFK